jgi:chromosome segregation ATPase
MDMKEIDRLSTALKSRTELIDKLKKHIRVLGSENNKLSELFDASGIDNNILHERIKVLSDEVYEAVKRARETEEALSAANERIKVLETEIKDRHEAEQVALKELFDSDERIEVLEDALKKSYRKHWLNDEHIGWQELGDIIYNALCISLGDDGFEKWLNEYRAALEVKL